MKTLSLKLDDDIFDDAEEMTSKLKMARNRYINEAVVDRTVTLVQISDNIVRRENITKKKNYTPPPSLSMTTTFFSCCCNAGLQFLSKRLIHKSADNSNVNKYRKT